MSDFTHFDAKGDATMVNVSAKAETERVAVAGGRITMQKATLEKIMAGNMKKGDVLSVARLAGIMGAKRTPDLIPLCHPLNLTSVAVELSCDPDDLFRRDHGDDEDHRSHRRRDGGADRGRGRRPHRLRHVQIDRSRHAHRRYSLASQIRRQVRHLRGRIRWR